MYFKQKLIVVIHKLQLFQTEPTEACEHKVNKYKYEWSLPPILPPLLF